MMLVMARRAVYPERSHPNLRALRLAAGLSQDALGYRTGIPQSLLSRAERGLLWLDEVERNRVAEALGVEADALDESEDVQGDAAPPAPAGAAQ